MITYDFLKEKFIEKHKRIDDDTYLDKYINFLMSYVSSDVLYTERHHILPRSTFPEFENEKWNLIELDYESHKLVHLWIYKAINIRTYQRPLNWMMNLYKDPDELSKASKRGWTNLKNDKVKYKKWLEARSNHMKGLSSQEQTRRCKIFWDKISDDEYLEFCEKMKSYWTEEKRKQKSIDMKEYYSLENNIDKKREESLNTWATRDVNYRKRFKQKMDLINKDITKRAEAGNKIRDKWKNDDYLSKMKNRKHRSGTPLKIVKGNGEEEIFDSMSLLSREYGISFYKIRKYLDKDKKIEKKDVFGDSISLVDSYIKTIK
jgi:hypothetical protein